jgi:hypothetical protein
VAVPGWTAGDAEITEVSVTAASASSQLSID